jgi:hypothetical protein
MAAYHDLKRLERGQAFGLACLAGRHRPDRAAVDEIGGVAALMRLGGGALEPDLEAEQRQRHATAAAEFPALDPRRQPSASQHSLVFQIGRLDAVARRQTESLDPLAAASRPDPLADLARHIAGALDVHHDIGVIRYNGLPGTRSGHGRPGLRTWFHTQTHHLQTRCALWRGRRGLVHRHQHLRRSGCYADQRGGVLAVQPAIVAERADADRFRPAGRARRQRNADARQTGPLVRRRRAGRLEDAEQAGVQRHQMPRDLEFADAVLVGLRITGLSCRRIPYGVTDFGHSVVHSLA